MLIISLFLSIPYKGHWNVTSPQVHATITIGNHLRSIPASPTRVNKSQ
jgi:hypothetical protein